MREIKKLIIHCSDTKTGSADAIRRFHMAPPPLGRGWSDIGYHFVVNLDGSVASGRAEEEVGAHCEGENHDSIGICLIGKDISDFTELQFIALKTLVQSLNEKYKLHWQDLFSHYEFDSAKLQGKTCPNLNRNLIRLFIKGDL